MKKILTVLCLFSAALTAFSYEVYIEDQSCMIDIPEAWNVIETTKQKVVIANQDNSAYCISRIYKDKKDSTINEFVASVTAELNAEAETSIFSYKDSAAAFSDIVFMTGDFNFRGYAFFLLRKDFAQVIMAFSDSDQPYMTSFLLSVIDSYADQDQDLYRPGPISRFMSGTGENEIKTVNVKINGKNLKLMYSPVTADITQWVIEREMTILTAYDPDETGMNAWIRCYRLIYRDAFKQTERLFTQIKRKIISKGMTKKQTADILLSWLQDFSYSRTDDLADFLNPVTCVVEKKGDCDSLAMLLVMLLKRFDIEAVLFVSHKISHAMTGIAIETEGAYMVHDGVRYYVAELTADVDIGQIDASMADEKSWLTIAFR